MAVISTEVTHVEMVKEASGGLVGSIGDELEDVSPRFSDDNAILLKFHGTYQQDNRDVRLERKDAGRAPDYRFMVRTRFPGGRLTAAQYLVCDALAREYADDDLRVTSRQNLQFHGIEKRDLHAVIRQLNVAGGITTLGAAGDVVRNVTAPPLADLDVRYAPFGAALLALADQVNDAFAVRTPGYRETWIQSGPSSGPRLEDTEPFYTNAYLPRKFKVAIATDFDNSTDVLANDVGLLAVTDGGRIRGYELFVGGGLGFSRATGDADARLAQPLGFIDASAVVPVIATILTVFRDHGCRKDRRKARLKHLLRDWGIEAFRARVAEALGYEIPRPLGVVPLGQIDYLGWHPQVEPGLNYVGIRLENGRIRDCSAAAGIKTGLREVMQRFSPGVRLTPQHDILLTHIPVNHVDEVQAVLDQHGISWSPQSPLRRHDLACPALPYCGMAVAEAERVLPQVLRALEARGHADADVHIRMSGCSNGCSRPRMAEIGVIGAGVDRYDVYVGGSRAGTRINQRVASNVDARQLVPALSALLTRWKQEAAGESFGDWSSRMSAEVLRQTAETASPSGAE